VLLDLGWPTYQNGQLPSKVFFNITHKSNGINSIAYRIKIFLFLAGQPSHQQDKYF
jgi:hypothetical protein